MENLIILSFIFVGVMLFLVLGSFIFFIWSIVDCIKSNMKSEHKLIWLVVIILLNVIGSLIYFIFAKRSQDESQIGENDKVLTKSNDDKFLFGVCGGIAKYFDIDSTLVRIIFVIVALFTGIGLLLYIIFAIALPKEGETNNKKTIKNKEITNSKKNKKNNTLIIVLIILGILLIIPLTLVLTSLYGLSNYRSNVKTEIIPFLKEERVHGDSVIREIIAPTKIQTQDIEKEIIDKIRINYNFQNYNGYDLILKQVRTLPREECIISSKDPYAFKMYSECTEYIHEFLINNTKEIQNTKGFEVKTKVIRNDIVEMNFITLN